MHCYILLVAILLPLLTGPANVAGQSQTSSPPAPPCEAQSEYKQFDFWVGTWNVEDTKGNAVGKTVIERLERGCILMENWTGLKGGTGKSINFYDNASHKGDRKSVVE